jgi:hypothetical protein
MVVVVKVKVRVERDDENLRCVSATAWSSESGARDRGDDRAWRGKERRLTAEIRRAFGAEGLSGRAVAGDIYVQESAIFVVVDVVVIRRSLVGEGEKDGVVAGGEGISGGWRWPMPRFRQ